MLRLSARTFSCALAALIVALAVPAVLLADDSHSDDSATSGQSQGGTPKPPDTKDASKTDGKSSTTSDDGTTPAPEPGDDQGVDPAGTGDATAPAPAPPTPAPPVPTFGKNVVVAPSKGKIDVQVPGSSSWQPLSAGDQLPVGAVVDARQGHITLTSAVSADGTAQTAAFWGGVFQVRQTKGGVTDLVLRGPKPTCSTASTRAVASAASTRHRRAGAGLWGHDHHGKFRTIGSNSVATVRGTTWFVQERCDGTYTKVTHGAVLVRDKTTGRSILLHAGQSHLARRTTR